MQGSCPFREQSGPRASTLGVDWSGGTFEDIVRELALLAAPLRLYRKVVLGLRCHACNRDLVSLRRCRRSLRGGGMHDLWLRLRTPSRRRETCDQVAPWRASDCVGLAFWTATG